MIVRVPTPAALLREHDRRTCPPVVPSSHVVPAGSNVARARRTSTSPWRPVGTGAASGVALAVEQAHIDGEGVRLTDQVRRVDGDTVTADRTHVLDVVAGTVRLNVRDTGVPSDGGARDRGHRQVERARPASVDNERARAAAVPASDTSTPDRRSRPAVVAVNVVPSGTATQSASAGFATPVCCTVAVNVCGTPDQVRRRRRQQHPVRQPRLRRRQRHHLVRRLTRRARRRQIHDEARRRSELVTVNVPDPEPADVTLTVHITGRVRRARARRRRRPRPRPRVRDRRTIHRIAVVSSVASP